MKDFRRPSGQGANRSGGFDRREGGDSRPSFGGGFNKYQGAKGNVRPEGQVKHQATCADCGNTCEVPFRPNGKKPVFCANCFGAKRDGGMKTFKKEFTPRSDERAPQSFSPAASAPMKDHRIDELKAQLGAISTKLDRLIDALEKKPAHTSEKAVVNGAEKKEIKAAPVAKVTPSAKTAPKKAAAAAKPAAKKPVAVKKVTKTAKKK